MATVAHNREFWNTSYDWSQQGEEWSVWWGNSEAQWWGSLLPRVHRFVPCESIVEIGPGFGRWTCYLKDLCQHLTVVDLSERCIQHCRERFAGCSHVTCEVNDGNSFDMVPNQAVDFAFSFDSLVHAEAEVLEAYVQQLARKLKDTGVAFIHRSNARRYRRHFGVTARLPRGRQFLADHGLLPGDCGRGLGLSADLFVEFCQKAGLKCVGEEIINWRGRLLIDCLSLVTHPGCIWDRPRQVVVNRDFMVEARLLSRWAPLHACRPGAAKT